MGKGPKRDKHTGRFVAKKSFMDRISPKKTTDSPPKKTKQEGKHRGNFALGRSKSSFLDQTIKEYKTKTVTVGGVKYRIPVDDNGFVPRWAIASRFLATDQGTGRNDKRNVRVDAKIDADEILPEKVTPEQLKKWWHEPNTRDVQGIDTADSDLYDVISLKSKGAREAHGMIAVDGTPEQQRLVRSVIENSFTVKEQKALVKRGGLVITFSDLGKNVAAQYSGKADGMAYKIVVNPDFIDDRNSYLHEIVHHSRLVDDDRKSVLLQTRSTDKNKSLVRISSVDDRSLEEAATVLESLARETPYKESIFPSYHADTAKNDLLVAHRQIKADRELVAGSAEEGSKGFKGVRAKKKVESEFHRSHISSLKLDNLTAKQKLEELSKQKK